jgi:hypothetical protein
VCPLGPTRWGLTYPEVRGTCRPPGGTERLSPGGWDTNQRRLNQAATAISWASENDCYRRPGGTTERVQEREGTHTLSSCRVECARSRSP